MEKTAEQLRREHIVLEGDTHGKNKWAILFTVLIMTFMVCLDSTVVTVALPVMQKELGVGLDRIQLVSSVYLLATCVAMLPFGRLGDVRGKVNVFQLGVIVFSVGSLLCGLSASLEVLILARIVQGIGCAAAMANNMGIITESFPARERGRAMGILATFVALGMMCGPVLGGMLVASFPWESIFLINLPIGVISFIVGLYTLPHVRPEAGERPMPLAEAARRCFANSAFTINLACMLIVFVGIGASEFILPFYFQDAHGFGSDISGLLFGAANGECLYRPAFGNGFGPCWLRGSHGGRPGRVCVRSLCSKHARRALFYPCDRVLRRIYVVRYVDFPEPQQLAVHGLGSARGTWLCG